MKSGAAVVQDVVAVEPLREYVESFVGNVSETSSLLEKHR